MNDHELLQFAAKAAGYQVIDEDWTVCGIDDDGNAVYALRVANGALWFAWNPLEDDGDALRLAVKLKMIIDVTDAPSVDVAYKHNGDYKVVTDDIGDASASVRRAIVLCAAEIGRRMP